MNLITPIGEIRILVDDYEVEYVPIKLPLGGNSYKNVTGRYAIPYIFELDGKEHVISCKVNNCDNNIETEIEPSECLESLAFINNSNTFVMHIGCFGEIWGEDDVTESYENGFDYEVRYIENGLQYIIKPTTKTSYYCFGICWKVGEINSEDCDTWIGAEPFYFKNYCVDPRIGTFTYNRLLELFENHKNVDETMFYFDDDELKTEHYLGYNDSLNKPYWAGYCDIDGGASFKTAKELFEAKIYDGQSIKEKWDNIVLVNIGGISILNYYGYDLVPGERSAFKESYTPTIFRIVMKRIEELDIFKQMKQESTKNEIITTIEEISYSISAADTTDTIAECICMNINKLLNSNEESLRYYEIAKLIKEDFKKHNIETNKYYCTSCGATLDNQRGFNPENPWICKVCGQQLSGDNNNNDVFENVVWYCDECEAILNKQKGFTEKKGLWICTECGFENELSEENIIDKKFE